MIKDIEGRKEGSKVSVCLMIWLDGLGGCERASDSVDDFCYVLLSYEDNFQVDVF